MGLRRFPLVFLHLSPWLLHSLFFAFPSRSLLFSPFPFFLFSVSLHFLVLSLSFLRFSLFERKTRRTQEKIGKRCFCFPKKGFPFFFLFPSPFPFFFFQKGTKKEQKRNKKGTKKNKK